MKFFTHEINSRNNDRVFELIDIHGLGGYGFYWVILEELYKAEDTGFQIEATSIWMKRLARSLNITDDRTVIRYFDTLANLGLISKQLWQEHVIYSPGVMNRADGYMQRKAKEAEKKRMQRAQAKTNTELSNNAPNLSLGIKDLSLGTKDLSFNVPIADPYAYSDPHSNSNADININIGDSQFEKLEIESLAVAKPENFKKSRSKKFVDPADLDLFEPFRIVWNENGVAHWIKYFDFDAAIVEDLKKFTKKYKSESLEIFRQGLQFLSADRFYGGQKVKWTLCQYLTNEKPFKFSCEYEQRQKSGFTDGNTHEDWLNALEAV